MLLKNHWWAEDYVRKVCLREEAVSSQGEGISVAQSTLCSLHVCREATVALLLLHRACLPACVCVCVSVCPLSLTWSAAVFHNMQEMGLIFSRRRRCTDFTSRLQSRLTEAQTEGVGETRQALVDKAGENMLVLITQIDPQAKHGTHNTNAEQSSDTPT